MCGIVGYVGQEYRAVDVLVDGLRRLEYRGYDSAGVAILEGGEIAVRFKGISELATRVGRLMGSRPKKTRIRIVQAMS